MGNPWTQLCPWIAFLFIMTTSVFRIIPVQYVRTATGIWMSRGGWLWLLPLASALFLGIADWRFFIVALAMICIVYPGALMMIYINHALRPEAAFATIPHRVALSPDGIDIEYFPADETVRCPASRHIPLADVKTAEDTGRSLIITLRSGRYDFILIPIAEFNGKFPKEFINLVNQA